MADQQDLDVLELEPELLDAGSDERDIRFEIAVDENVPLRRGDQIVRQPLAADVVEIARNAEGWKWLRPVRVVLRGNRAGERQGHDGDPEQEVHRRLLLYRSG